jgi:murein L,D-transpeptidase YafK
MVKGPIIETSLVQRKPLWLWVTTGVVACLIITGAFFAGRQHSDAANVTIAAPQSISLSAAGRASISRTNSRLGFALDDAQIAWASPVFLRLIKSTGRLEVWMVRNDRFVLFRRYKVCGDSDLSLGPRLRSAPDRVPEGIYRINAQSLSTRSGRYLGVAIGWPTAVDRRFDTKVPDGAVLLDGRCAGDGSIGLTDQDMEEVFTLLWAALQAGQSVINFHIYPQPMGQSLSQGTNTTYEDLYQDLYSIWRAGGGQGNPPTLTATAQGYHLDQ